MPKKRPVAARPQWRAKDSTVTRYVAEGNQEIAEAFFSVEGSLPVEARHRLAEHIANLLNKGEDKIAWDLRCSVVRAEHPDKDLVFGRCWECPRSPTRYCVYDDAEDGCHDDCLYCGGPEERK